MKNFMIMPPKVRAVYFKELRDCLRDRRTIFASVIVPILLYPVMLIGVAQVAQVARAKMDREKFVVAIPDHMFDFFNKLSQSALETLESADDPDLEIINDDLTEAPARSEKLKAPSTSAMDPSNAGPTIPLLFVEMSASQAMKELASGAVRAVVSMPPDIERRILAREPAEIKIQYDQAEHRSREALKRLTELFDRHKKRVLRERLKLQNLQEDFLKPFKYSIVNVAQAEKVGGSVMGSFLPLLFIMMIITGSIYPAIDMTAGEKERSTLETLISMPVKPIEIITGKFLAVATLALANAALNVGSFALTFSAMPAVATASLQFPWSALPLTLLLLIPLTLLFAALLLAVSSFAANHKEAQIYCLPVYLIPVLGMMLSSMPGIELEGPLLLAPVLNTALLIKELFLNHGTTKQIAFVFFSTCFYAAGMVALAARVFAREEVLFSAQGSLRLFLNRKYFTPGLAPKPGDSLLVIALLFPIYFYFSLWIGKAILDPINGLNSFSFALLIGITQYGIFLGIPLLAAWYLKLNMKKTFLWHRPHPMAVLGSMCLGCGSWIVAMQLFAWQSHFWPCPPGDLEMLEKPLRELSQSGTGTALLILLLGITPGICEEHIFRGFLQQGLIRSGKWLGLLSVGVIFGMYHLSLFKLPILILMGILLAYVAYQTRSIWPGVIFHMLHNSLSLVGPALYHFGEEKPIPGQPLQGIPLIFLIPATLLFLLGILLVKTVPRPLVETD